ncbi:MAG: hypothetical protein FWD16_05225 [Clostridia bacterium]|nr:hypothetical protein [Clostridia bacterium]
MTTINWISAGITVAVIITCVILKLYYNKKLRDLDGVVGIIKPDRNEDE